MRTARRPGGKRGGAAPEAAPASPAVSCESLQGRTFYNVVVTGAVSVPAASPLPAYCKVTGSEPGTRHDLEVRLPLQWQGRYVQRGGGGFDGSIPPAAAAANAFAVGAAQGVNNGGHRDPSGAALLGDPRAIERYAHGAILIATRFGKAVTQAFYGRYPEHSYYDGCSNGGRGALNAASKYGNEFDGVVAAAPTTNLAGQIAQWTSAAALSMPSAEQFTQIHAAAVAKCDALDGLKDGIVSHPSACRFDPGKDVPKSVGLTPPQVTAVRTLMSDIPRADGGVLYSGYGTGNLGLGAPAFGLFGTGQMRSIVMSDARWSPEGFDPAVSLPAISRVIDEQYQFSASTAGLIQFMRGGGKVLVWHGADDGLLSHRDTLRTWSAITTAAGEPLAGNASRFYIAPGVNHCAGGDGADSFDTLGAMVDWVEKARAPETLLASKINRTTGAVQFTRPLCRYPAWPRYSGRGDPDAAESFACVAE